MENTKLISELLLHCEEKGLAPKYVYNKKTYKEQGSSFFRQSLPVRTDPVEYNCKGEEIFVVSDLHIASGRNFAGVYEGTENFFAAEPFRRFLKYADNIKKTDNALLVINGDLFDFLRVTDCPGKVKEIRTSKRIKQALKLNFLPKKKKYCAVSTEEEYEEWRSELEKIGIKKSAEVLENSINKKEVKYGLKTDDYKTIYKLIKIRRGHPDFFKALSEWMGEGNKLLVLKGNHDLELYWPAVRNYIRLLIADGIVDEPGDKNIDNVLRSIVLPNLTFVDDSVEIDGDFYLEHGHRYDKFCMVLDDAVLKNNQNEINIPFGSFFNRYLLNRVELFYPFLDNVKPPGNVLSILFRENFPLGLKILFMHIPVLFKMLMKKFRYAWFMFNRVFWLILALLLPFIIIYLFYPGIVDVTNERISSINNLPGAAAFFLDQLKNVGLLIASYLLTRLVAWFQLEEPTSLHNFARIRFKDTEYKIMTMGHTHNPGEYTFKMSKNDCRRFYNTGTWIPVVELSTADIRDDKTYTFLYLERDVNGKLRPGCDGLLQRWNDDAGRAEPQRLVQRK